MNKKLKIIKCEELPQWITSSHLAAYYPFENIIYLTKWRYLPHEILHYLAHKLKLNFLHNLIDKHYKIARGRSKTP